METKKLIYKPEKKAQIIGDFVNVMLGSKMYRRYDIEDIEAVFFPAIYLNQFRIYHQNNQAIAFVTWAKLSKEIEREYIINNKNLTIDEWNSGDNIWAMDFSAPYGHAKEVIKDLKDNIFPNTEAKALKVDKEGNVRTVIKLFGNNIKQTKEKRL